MPGPGDFCHGCNRLLCRCQPELDCDVRFEASYEAGYDACLADGYCERPLTEWVYPTGSHVTWDAEAGCLHHHMTPLRFAELTWRHRHASVWAYGRWFERQYGYDLESYLAGYDDAGAGLPSEVSEPEHHARWGVALDAYGPIPEPEPEAIQSPPEAVGADDWMPF